VMELRVACKLPKEQAMQFNLKSQSVSRVTRVAGLVMFATSVLLRYQDVARADIVELKEGGVLCGKVLNPSSGQTVQIQTDDGSIIEVDRKLTKIRISLERDSKYLDIIANKGDSLEDHRKVVEQCSTLQMLSLANAHRERIVELDPNDRATWEILRYYPDAATGKWIRRDVVMYKRGKIKGDKGRYFTWQEKALIDFDEKVKLQKRDAEREFDGKLKAYLSGNGRVRAEAEAYLQALNNPLLIGRLAKLFREGNVNERGLYMQLLKQMPIRSVAPAMVSIALEDQDMSAVGEALEALQAGDEMVRELAVTSFAMKLANPATRDRAAYCMIPFNDKRFISMLINHLVSTQVVRPAGPPGGLNAGTGSGGVGFTGGAPQAQKRLVQHKDVLSALQSLTGENFGFNVDDWRRWFATSYAVQNLDLRRDEY